MTAQSRRLTQDLESLHSDIEAMALRVEEDLRKAILALRSRDGVLAARVKADDRRVNSLQGSIQDFAVSLIATKQPVARDLRELVASIRLADRLERSGDYTVHLAKTASRLGEGCWPHQCELLARMGEIGCSMIQQMIEAWLAKDLEAARSCIARDKEIDELHHRLIGLTLAMIKDRPMEAEEAVRLIRTSGFMERLGDHIANACELIEYTVEGTQPHKDRQDDI